MATHTLVMHAYCGMRYEIHRGDLDTCRAVMQRRVAKHDGPADYLSPNEVELEDPGDRMICDMDGILTIKSLQEDEDDG